MLTNRSRPIAAAYIELGGKPKVAEKALRLNKNATITTIQFMPKRECRSVAQSNRAQSELNSTPIAPGPNQFHTN
jgi:hypothetical protein